jgi:pectinesterase
MSIKIKNLYTVLFCLLLVNCTAQKSSKAEKGKPKQYDIVVDSKGSGDFLTVQEAINSVPDQKQKETKIYIKNGIYKEKIEVSVAKINITLIGEDRAKTILTYDDFAPKKNAEGKEIGTSGSYSFAVGGDNFKAVNLTFENSAGPVGQAVAVRVDGDKVIFENCNLLGFQDTLYTRAEASRQFYKNCYIEGATDFIFGASTAVFEDCEIFSKPGGYYITAASTILNQAYGYVFINCKLTGNAPKGTVFLGRPWRPYAQTVFINTQMGAHITPEGWNPWKDARFPDKEKTAFYAEFGSKGDGATDPSKRVSWSHQLDKSELSKYDLDKVFKGWNPRK